MSVQMNIALDGGAIFPTRAHDTDAGLDLLATSCQLVPTRGSATFDTGIRLEIPHGYFGKIESKSGLNVNHSIVSCGGVIDEGYTGSIRVKLYNLSDEDYQVLRGDKIAQLIIQPYIAPRLIRVDALNASERGENGFGSTGR